MTHAKETTRPHKQNGPDKISAIRKNEREAIAVRTKP